MGVQNDFWLHLKRQPQECSVNLQSNFVTKTYVCLDSLVAKGKGKQLEAKTSLKRF